MRQTHGVLGRPRGTFDGGERVVPLIGPPLTRRVDLADLEHRRVGWNRWEGFHGQLDV